jgi:hypothetical protein
MSAGPTERARNLVRSHRDELLQAAGEMLVKLAGSEEAADDLAEPWYEFFQAAMDDRTQKFLPMARYEECKQALARIWALYQLADNILAESVEQNQR